MSAQNSNKQFKKPSKQEQHDNDMAVRMIIFVACLNYAMVDVQFELEELGLFRQQTKRYFNLANKQVMFAHNKFFNMLNNKKFANATTQYLTYTDKTWDNVNANVMLERLEGAVNKALSLCRLSIKYNEILRGRYDCYFVDELANVEKYLKGLGVNDYNLDFLIERQMCY